MDENTINSLPLGWTKTTLGELARPTRPRHEPREYPELPFIGMEHVEAQTMRLLGTVPAKTMASSAVHFYPDDVLYGRLRPYLNKVYRPDFEGLCSGEFIVFPTSENMDSKFLQYLLNSADFVSFTSSLNTGDRPRVDYGQMAPYGVNLPPLTEQRRIVQEIEKHFSRLDAAVSGLKRVRANLDRYRASVLKAACEGRLVPAEANIARAEGRTYQPAEQLLARVLEERRARWEEEQLARMKKQGREPKNDKWKAKYQEPIKLDPEKLGLLPEGWCFASLDQLTHFITSGSRGWAAHYSETGQIFIRSQDINTDRLILDSVAHVSVPDSAEGRRTRVTRHDILITITGANVTKAARVVQDPGEAYVSQHVALIRLISGDITPYAYVWIISPAHGRGRLEKAAYGAGKPGLNLDNLRELPVALPPVNEQKRIAAEVERRLSVIENLEVVVRNSLKRVERLRQAVLKRAFEGRLVVQDRADEPAELLLERIKAERAAAAAEGPKRGRRERGQPGFEWPQVDGAAKGAAPAAEG